MKLHAYLSAVLLLAAACKPMGSDRPVSPPQPPQTVTEPGDPARRLKQVEQELATLHADQPCNADAQCAALPLGAKGCGGPTGFMPVSAGSPDKARAERLSGEHTALSRKIVETSGMVSDCMMMTPPEYRCVREKCAAP